MMDGALVTSDRERTRKISGNAAIKSGRWRQKHWWSMTLANISDFNQYLFQGFCFGECVRIHAFLLNVDYIHRRCNSWTEEI